MNEARTPSKGMRGARASGIREFVDLRAVRSE